jgi:hypothetical protein
MVTRRVLALVFPVLGVATIVVGLRLMEGHRRAPRSSAEGPGEAAAAARSYPSSTEGTPSAAAARPDDPSKHVAEVVDTWRNAILQKDADTVVRLDLTFREAPERYLTALLQSARSDANERVRAFSARELGKLARPELAPEFRQMLGDGSPYVRQNAAWALGELANLPGGLAAAHEALADLKRTEARDPVRDVRSAARSALAHLE